MLNLILLLGGVILSVNVKADENIYYTNSNGVSMTETQYNYLKEMFFENYPNYITGAEYNELLTKNLFTKEIVKTTTTDYGNQVSPQSNYHETNAKVLTLSKSCSSTECLMVFTNAWKGDPNVKSYDLIGALLFGNLTLNSGITSKLYYSGGTLYGDGTKHSNNGWGVSFKLPTSTSLMTVTQHFYVYGTGTVFTSYQHAVKNISLATSQKFTCNYGGWGGVFDFYGTAVSKFDHTAGVDMGITV
jgi:hypothetical protein